MEYEFEITDEDIVKCVTFDALIQLMNRRHDAALWDALVKGLKRDIPEDVKLPTYGTEG